MWHCQLRSRTTARRLPNLLGGALGTALFLTLLFRAAPLSAESFPPNPVEQLKAVLKQDSGTLYKDAARDAEREKSRRERIEKSIKSFRFLGDIAAALVLEEWVFYPESFKRADDREYWNKLAVMFRDGIAVYLENGNVQGDDPNSLSLRFDRQQAAAKLLRDLGSLSRDNKAKFPLLRTVLAPLVPRLVALVSNEQANMRVRVAAVEALGRINPMYVSEIFFLDRDDPGADLKKLREQRTKGREALTTSVGAMKALLDPSQPVEVRRAAARSLADLADTITQFERPRSLADEFAVLDEADALFGSNVIIAAALQSFLDSDALVRARAIDAILTLARSEGDFLVTTPFEPRLTRSLDLADEGKLKEFEAQRDSIRNDAEQQFQDFCRSLGKAAGTRAKDGVMALGDLTSDPDSAVRQRAVETLRELAMFYLRLKPGALQPGAPSPEKGSSEARLSGRRARLGAIKVAYKVDPEKAPDQAILSGLEISLPALARALMDPDPQVRLNAVEAMELLAPEIVEFERTTPPGDPRRVSGAIVRSMDDPDRWVRWAAARTVGKLDRFRPDKATVLLARIVDDTDIDSQKVACRTLATYGPLAIGALPSLIRAVERGDAELQDTALTTIEAIGTDAYPAIPAITRALSAEKPNVRRHAADLLGRFGPLGLGSIPALQQAQNDTDPDVRRAASQAIINIKAQQPETLPLRPRQQQ
jgi:HEAT repeat protein